MTLVDLLVRYSAVAGHEDDSRKIFRDIYLVFVLARNGDLNSIGRN